MAVLIVVEKAGPFEAMQRSMSILRRAWGEAFVGNQPDRATAAAIAAIGAAERDELLATEADAAVAAVAGMDFDDRFVDEFHRGQW